MDLIAAFLQSHVQILSSAVVELKQGIDTLRGLVKITRGLVAQGLGSQNIELNIGHEGIDADFRSVKGARQVLPCRRILSQHLVAVGHHLPVTERYLCKTANQGIALSLIDRLLRQHKGAHGTRLPHALRDIGQLQNGQVYREIGNDFRIKQQLRVLGHLVHDPHQPRNQLGMTLRILLRAKG